MGKRIQIEEGGIPDLPTMMLAIIEALREIGGSASIQEMDEKVAEIEELSEEEQSFEMSGTNQRPRYNYYSAWARTFLKRGGALENSARGVWALTETGQSIKEYSQTKQIHEQVNEEEKERARQKHLAKKRVKEKAVIKPKHEEIEFEQQPENEFAGDGWKAHLLEVLGNMDPGAFERLSQRLLRESGFTKVEVRGQSGDGGIDGVGALRVNLVSFRVYFQCKRWKGSVGSPVVRDFRGAMDGRADKGIVITTGKFTASASDEATRDGAITIDLIDGNRLCELLKESGLGVETKVETKNVEHVTVAPEWFSTV